MLKGFASNPYHPMRARDLLSGLRIVEAAAADPNLFDRTLLAGPRILFRISVLSTIAGVGLVIAAHAQLVTTNLLINPGAETGDLTGWTVGGDSNPFTGAPTNSLGDGFPTHSGSFYFVGGTGATGSLSQMVIMVGNQGITAALLDSGSLFASVSFWEQGLNQAATNDDANVSIVFFDAATNVLQTVSTPLLDSTNNSWQNYSNQYPIPPLTRFIQYAMIFYRNAGNDLDAFIDDNNLVVVQNLAASSAAYTFTTLAGFSGAGSADGVGSSAQFSSPSGVAVDTNGNVYVADFSSSTIRKITPAAVVTTLAGSPGSLGSADGVDSAARFRFPVGIAADSAGNVYVADLANYTIRKLSPVGTNWEVSTIAGLAGSYGSTDGTNSAARFGSGSDGPRGVAVDAAGNIYVADTGNNNIRKITPVGTNWAVTTLAGSAGSYGSADGTGNAARFGQPYAIVVDAASNLYVGDVGNNTIRMITPAGVVSTITGSVGVYGSRDGTNSDAQFNNPWGVAVDNAGHIYVAEYGNGTVRKIMRMGGDWVVSTLAGLAQNFGSADGTGNAARFNAPVGIGVDSSGNLYVGDYNNHTVRKVTSAGVVRTLAGSAVSSGSTDGTGSAARFYNPSALAVDAAGDVFVADSFNHTIRQITSAGAVSTVAGLAGSAGSADGAGSDARFWSPYGLTLDASGNLYVTDSAGQSTNTQGNGVIREITPAGVVSTIAGTATGPAGFADGIGTNALFVAPSGIAVDNGGNLYVADYNTIRRITPVAGNWVVSTIAGLAGVPGYIDGTNSAARFNNPVGVAVDMATNLFVADNGNHALRKITPVGTNWIVSTLFGSLDTNTPPSLQDPRGVAVAGGSVFLTDGTTIRGVTSAGALVTLAGLAYSYGSADGAGSAARFFNPAGVAVDSAGNLYVADSGNNTIRKGLFTAYAATNPVPYLQPPMNAQLVVTLSPLEANGQWRFPWELGWRKSGTTAANLVAGNYPVEFRNVPGWQPIPARVSVAVTNNGTVPLSSQYYPTLASVGTNGGSLTVNIGPSPPSGVGWRFLGDPTPFPAFPPGYSTNLLPGTYLIEFAPVNGYSKPPNQAVQVFAGQPTVLAETYLLAGSAPGGTLLPAPVPSANISDLADYPFGFNGQLQSDVGYGSGVAVQANVVLTAAHLVFNDQNLSFVNQAYWFFQEETDVFAPEPLLARSWYVLSGYAAQRTNDVLGGLGPDQSSPQSRNMDVAALYFQSHVAGGGYGGYLPSDVVPNPWLTGTSLKMLVGYPVDASQFGDVSLVPGRMYRTDPQPYPLNLAADPVSNQRVYTANWFLSYPGNSGGPLYVQFNGYYYPAAVYLGTLYSGIDPHASAVRAIDSDVVNLITIATSEGASGSNHTGGGVITIIPNQNVSSSTPGYVQFQLAPPAAVQQGAAWRLQGDSSYSTSANYTRAVISTNAFAVEFKPIPGWNLPTNQTTTVFPGVLITNIAFYTVTNPVLMLDRAFGLGLTGTTGTVYRIEGRASLSSGSWLPLNTNTILSNGFNAVLPLLPTNPPATYYRALWLPGL